VDGQVLRGDEFALTIEPKPGVVCHALPGNHAIVVLDLELSPDLVQEGMARDVVRVVQQARKEAGLHVADHIRLVVPLAGDWREAVEQFRRYVCEQTLATELLLDEDSAHSAFRSSARLGGSTVVIGLEKC
jgi:isoleucyl-tRNA synthetase